MCVRGQLESPASSTVLAKATFTGPRVPLRVDMAVCRNLYRRAFEIDFHEAAIAFPLIPYASQICIGGDFDLLATSVDRLESPIAFPSIAERRLHGMSILRNHNRSTAAVCLSIAAITSPTRAVRVVEVSICGYTHQHTTITGGDVAALALPSAARGIQVSIGRNDNCCAPIASTAVPAFAFPPATVTFRDGMRRQCGRRRNRDESHAARGN